MSCVIGSKVPYDLKIIIQAPIMPSASKLVMQFSNPALSAKMLTVAKNSLARSYGDDYELPINQCHLLFDAVVRVMQDDTAAHLPKSFVGGYLKNMIRDGFISQEDANNYKSHFRYSYTSNQFERAIKKGLNPDLYTKINESYYVAPVVQKV